MAEARLHSPFVPWPAGQVLVLGSRSPRRAELLRTVGIPFEVHPPGDVEENLASSLAPLHAEPSAYAVALAEAKGRAVAAARPGRLVLAADTVVLLGGDLLEKPRDEDDAVNLLTRLSGREHTVITALTLVGGPAGAAGTSGWEATRVEFMALEAAAIRRYVATGEPMDKAGAYGIQGYGAMMVRRVQGCYFNVMGLPLARLGEMLRGVLR
jgi:septum formation protein